MSDQRDADVAMLRDAINAAIRRNCRPSRYQRLSARTRKGLSNEALAFGMGAVAGGATVAAAWLATMSVRAFHDR